MDSPFEIAKTLAEAHRREDPATTEIYFLEAPGEVRLLEVSGSVGTSPEKHVLPFRFKEQPDQGIPLPSVVILLSPEEWAAVQRNELSLPAGWDWAKLKKIA